MKITNETLLDADYEALANLRYRIRKFREFSMKAARSVGLSSQEHQALLAIKGLPSGKQMTAGMLADRLLISPQAATTLVDRLLEAGYIEQTAETTQRRKQTFRLTDKAEDILKRLTGAHLYEIREMAPDLMQALRILQDRKRMEQAAWIQ